MKLTIKKFLQEWTCAKYDGMSADELTGMLEKKLKGDFQDIAVQDEMNCLDDAEAEDKLEGVDSLEEAEDVLDNPSDSIFKN